MKTREDRLFLVLGAFFITNALIAELIGGKIFSLEKTLGFSPVEIPLFGSTYGFNLTAGVVLWPVVFIMTDTINEYFGKSGVRRLSYLAVGMILYAFLMIFVAMEISPADFWKTDKETGLDMNLAFIKIFGQGLWIIAGSMVAFLVGQIIDAHTFHYIKNATGSRNIWMRATGSTLVSQLIDSFVVLFIAFYLGPQKWPFTMVIAVGVVNYIYKFVVALALIPLLYLIHGLIDRYLGKERSDSMIEHSH